MPSDLKAPAAATARSSAQALAPPPEPPSVKLIVRLFLIPLLIAAAVIGIMVPFGWLTGGQKSLDLALADLKRPGGQRTGEWLVGPGAKQRYIDAKTIIDHLRENKLDEAGRIKLTGQLVDILDHYTAASEGEVQHVLLLALGQVWLRKPDPERPGEYLPETDSPSAATARKRAIETILRYSDAQEIATRKAATLALAYWKGREEAQAAIPRLIEKLQKDPELDVKMAAATALGQLAEPTDTRAIDALGQAMRDSDPHEVELVWNAAIALAELNRPEAKDVVLRLLDRKELDGMQYYDRETDPKNPRMQPLSEFEKERILINAMLAARHFDQGDVQAAIAGLAASDPSERVKQAAQEILEKRRREAHR
jgi:hypothetical protein